MDEEETLEMSGEEEYSEQGAMMMATVIHRALENKKKVDTWYSFIHMPFIRVIIRVLR